MAVTSVVEELSSPEGEHGQTGSRSYTRTFLVYCSSVSDGPVTVLNSTDLPAIGDSYAHGTETDTGVYCTKKNAQRISDDGRQYRATCTYENAASNPDDNIANPLDRTTKLDFEILKIEVPVDKDRDDAAVENSAGAPFDPPPTKVEPVLALHFRRNVTTYNVDLALQYVETVNNATFYDIPAGQAKCDAITWSEEMFENGTTYREERITILARGRSWQPEFLDIGMYRITNDLLNNTRVIVLKDQHGHELNEPAKLDGEGGVLPLGDDPVYLPFNILEERDFTALNL